MFGLGKRKTLDQDLFIENLTNSTLEMWRTDGSPELTTLSKARGYTFYSGRYEVRYKKAKAAFIVAFAVKAISDTRNVEFKDRYIELVSNTISEQEEQYGSRAELEKYIYDITDKVIDAFTAMGNTKGGKRVEKLFSKNAFGIAPYDEDIDASYFLYKAVSQMQRRVIRMAQRSYISALKKQ